MGQIGTILNIDIHQRKQRQPTLQQWRKKPPVRTHTTFDRSRWKGKERECSADCLSIGLAVGLKKGHKVESRDVKPRISRSKGNTSKRTLFVREIVKEVAGYAALSALNDAGETWTRSAWISIWIGLDWTTYTRQRRR